MQNSQVDIILVLGAFAGMLSGFYLIVKLLIGQASKDRDADRQERKALTDAMGQMAKSNKLIADETRKGNQEAKERNGHLGAQNIQLAKLVTDQNKDVSDIRESTALTAKTLSRSALIAAEDRDVLVGGMQVVHEQKVEHQTVLETK